MSGSARPERVVLAGRGSRLALRQTESVAAMLRRVHPGLVVDIVTVSTSGDRDFRPFAEIGGRGLFTAEVQRAVTAGTADAAVHSAKDLTADLAPGCAIVCVPGRADPRDAVVGGTGDGGDARLASLPPGAAVGTSSMRRRALLLESRPDLEPVDFRGNLDTRIAKVAAGAVAAALVARAGAERLGSAAAAAIEDDRWVPAPAQGALAVEALTERSEIAALFAPLDDAGARAEVTAERAFAARLEGGCSVPLGCLARISNGRLVVTGFLGLPDGSAALRDRISGPASEAAALGAELADAMLGAGGRDLLDELDPAAPPPAAP